MNQTPRVLRILMIEDEAGDARRRFQVADIGLDRADRAALQCDVVAFERLIQAYPSLQKGQGDRFLLVHAHMREASAAADNRREARTLRRKTLCFPARSGLHTG